jgi:hypothetical protein
MLGHLNLDLTFVVPLLVSLVVQRVRGDLSRPRFVAVLAVALLVQLGLATEILATPCVFGGITWVIFLAFAAPDERSRLWAVAREIILAGAITVALATPFLFFVVKGVADKSSQININSPELFSADLLNYLIPTKVTRLGSNSFGDMAHRFTGNPSEQRAYLSRHAADLDPPVPRDPISALSEAVSWAKPACRRLGDESLASVALGAPYPDHPPGAANPFLHVCRTGCRACGGALAFRDQRHVGSSRALHVGRTRLPLPRAEPSDVPLDAPTSST